MALALAFALWYGTPPAVMLGSRDSMLTWWCRQTLTLPKPLVEFGNKRMILHQIEALAAAGVTDIVLAVNYRPEIMEKYLREVSNTTAARGPRELARARPLTPPFATV